MELTQLQEWLLKRTHFGTYHITPNVLLHSAWTVFLLAFGILIPSLFCIHIFTSFPIQHLGHRPYGSGLTSFVLSQFFPHTMGDGKSCIWGYDSSVGAVSPIFRLIFHLVMMLLLYGVNLFFFSFLLNTTNHSENHHEHEHEHDSQDKCLIVLAFGTSVIYLSIVGIYWNFFPGVSHPGPARSNQNKIHRQPQWDNIETSIIQENQEESKQKEWTCVVAQESHCVTEQRFQSVPMSSLSDSLLHGKNEMHNRSSLHVGLTGEPFGRQMWWYHDTTRTKQSDRDMSLDQKRVLLEMASGGRWTQHSTVNTMGTFNPSINPNSADIPFRFQMIRNYVEKGGILPNVQLVPKTITETIGKAVHFYSMLQTEDGHWAGDYGGPHFLMPGLVIAWYVTGKPSLMLDQEQCKLMTHYLKVHQQSDGGWGTHIESPSTMFGTVMCYVALRLLGAHPNSSFMKRGRIFIKKEGGAVMTSSWAKFWLCLLGCMPWEGHNPVPPEMWLLPKWFPFHPSRLWCHCRMVYLPMGYLYGAKFVYREASTDPIILGLRDELYNDNYDSIPWNKTRHLVAEIDNYSPIPRFMKMAQNVLTIYETWSLFLPLKNYVRNLGMKFCVEYMAAEDLQTNFIDIGPVNKALNLISAFHAAEGNLRHPTVLNHMMRVPDYLWIAEDGMKMQGYNGSQCWDTSFAIQAISECNLLDEFPLVSSRVWSYLERTQILSTDISQASPAYLYESLENRDRFNRHVSKGGWPFSTSAHGWPISDCTGEGLKGVLVLMQSRVVMDAVKSGLLKSISESRLCDAVNVILTLQNEDGGWATYENNRGFGWYEQLNPSEVFGDIMIDYSYVECSMASLTGLAEFHKLYPNHRRTEIQHAIRRGRDFIKSIQRKDGSWYGSWACCFCYGCWFGIEGLIKAGEPSSSHTIQLCCKFLLSHQRSNGGWGEDFTSCYNKDYACNGMHSYGDHGSGVVNTAWALLALSDAKCSDIEAIRKGVQYLMARQLPSGDWPQEGIAGVFNRACGITYTAYRNVFPIWALGRCRQTYGELLE